MRSVYHKLTIVNLYLIFHCKILHSYFTCHHLFDLLILLENKTDINDEEQVIVTMFISAKHGIKIQDVRAIAADAKLLSVAAPFLITLQKLNIVREVLNGFAGLQNCNKATKDAVLDFSYNLSLGNYSCNLLYANIIKISLVKYKFLPFFKKVTWMLLSKQ